MATIDTSPRKPSVAAILHALRQRPNATAAALAEFAGIGRSTADRVLAGLEAEGRALRQRDEGQAGARTPARWVLTNDGGRTDQAEAGKVDGQAWEHDETAPPATDAEGSDETDGASANQAADAESLAPVEVGVEPAAEQAPDGSPSVARLRPGALRAMVHAWLAERLGQEFSPARIGKELGRSAGAVGNALVTMAEQGEVVQSSAKPRRYMIAALPDAPMTAVAETAKAS